MQLHGKKMMPLSEMLSMIPSEAPEGAVTTFLKMYDEAYERGQFEAVYLRHDLPDAPRRDELVSLSEKAETWMKRALLSVTDDSPHASLAASEAELQEDAKLFDHLAKQRRAQRQPPTKPKAKTKVTPKAQAQPKAKAAVPKTGAALARAAAGESDEATDDQSQQVQSPEGQGHEAQGQQGQGHAQANPNGQGDEAQSKAEGSPSDEGHSDEAPNEQANGAGAAAPPSSPPTPPTVRQPPVPNT
ncbi:hypothetical protein Dxin01_00780 [Deinococcus xinjiangensis]|uniref:Uncharacterized protein n=1 Tax=Deinococcus xinjiangensis TaxID=457454 RepID=A0ABP9V700_9DEIO